MPKSTAGIEPSRQRKPNSLPRDEGSKNETGHSDSSKRQSETRVTRRTPGHTEKRPR